MASIRIKVNPKIYKWVLDNIDLDDIQIDQLNCLKLWMSGVLDPTFFQLEVFSKHVNIPFGYFFLDTPPEEKIDLLKYRTITPIQSDKASRNLIDTIDQMEEIQDWMSQELKELGHAPLSIVGSVDHLRNPEEIAEQIRNDLSLETEWYRSCRDTSASFAYLQNKLESIGILVISGSYVGSDTQRVLDINECRAFTLVEDYAPLIFINTNDSPDAILFSLVHEMVHVWLGQYSLYNTRGGDEEHNDLERTCNAVAKELLVPRTVLIQKWKEHNEQDEPKSLQQLVNYFRCGTMVVARSALDLNFMSKSLYDSESKLVIEQYEKQEKKEIGTGADYNNYMCSRLGKRLLEALNYSVAEGRTTYTKAYRLTNTNRNTFDVLVNNLVQSWCQIRLKKIIIRLL